MRQLIHMGQANKRMEVGGCGRNIWGTPMMGWDHGEASV